METAGRSLKKWNGKPNGVNSQLLTSSNQGNSWPLSKPRLEMVERWGWAKKGFNMVTSVVKDLAVFCIARTYMRFLGTHAGCYATHVPCYATACARTVCILHRWGGRGCMRCLGTHVECHPTAHTCIMLRNCMCSYCSFTARMGWGWGGERGCMRCFGTHVGCYATAHTCFTKRRSKTRLTGAQGQTNCKEVCQKACEVEASLIDASILGWNGTCTATCGVSTTETGGSSSESCASNNEKKQAKTAKEVFFWWVVVPNVLEGLLRISKH